MEQIHVGMRGESTRLVEERFTAAHVGSGTLRVLATPSMIGFMERTCLESIQTVLPVGQSSVGTMVNIRHIAATPMDQEVKIVSEVTAVEGRRVLFHVEAWDASEKVGEGEHERYVIDVERFIKRVQAKAEEMGGA